MSSPVSAAPGGEHEHLSSPRSVGPRSCCGSGRAVQNAEPRVSQTVRQVRARATRDILSKRFDRFAILDTLNYQESARCLRSILQSDWEQGVQMPAVIAKHIREQSLHSRRFRGVGECRVGQERFDLSSFCASCRSPALAGSGEAHGWGRSLMKEWSIRICAQGEICNQRARHGALAD